MKAFFKNNLSIIILFLVGIALTILGSMSNIVLAGAMIVFAVAFGMLSLRFRKKYKQKTNYDYTQDYFDATSLGYDEDVYFIGNKPSRAKEIKGKFASLDAMAPFLLFMFLSIGCVIIAIYTLFQLTI